MKTKIQEAISLVKQTNDLLNDVASILSDVEKKDVVTLHPNESSEQFTNKCKHDITIKTKPDGALDNKRIKVTPETKEEIEAIIRSHGYEVYKSYMDMKDGFYWLVYSKYEPIYTYATNKYIWFKQLTEIYIHNGQLVDELPSKQHKEVCKWKHKHEFFLIDMSWIFCPYCGKKLEA